mgnify:CR=1 FL=1
MRVVRKINNNAAVCVDDSGRELVAFGKGIGFPPTPYELQDTKRIERMFYDIHPKYLPMVAELPQSVVLASADIAQEARTLQCELNPNLPFTLADHLNFAITRIKSGMDIAAPLAYDVKYMYPRETAIGFRALEILERYAHIRLPDSEAYSIAMHIINAEAEQGNAVSLLMTVSVISELEEIIEQHFQITLDRENYSYSRFVMHLRYLIQRLCADKQMEVRVGQGMLEEMKKEYGEAFACAQRIQELLMERYQWRCNSEELMYLVLHIQRLQNKH